MIFGRWLWEEVLDEADTPLAKFGALSVASHIWLVCQLLIWMTRP